MTVHTGETMANQATLADVALLAGVSLATASRALGTGHGRTVGADLRARVRAAAAELNYSPNAHAQAMRGASSTIGLIVHDILDPFATSIASGVLEAARDRNLLVSIAATGTDPDTEVQLVESLRRQRASAVILVGSRFADSAAQRWLAEEAAAIRASGGQVVVVGQDQLNTPAIVIDNAEGAEHLAKVLWSQGYRRFAVLAGPEFLLTSEERLAGFRQGLASVGYPLPDENVIGSAMTRDGGHTAMTELLDREIDVDCVFAVNDVMAVGAMAALRDLRLSVPKDMGMAGFGDIAALRDIEPALTTVRLPLVAIGRQALGLALVSPVIHSYSTEADGDSSAFETMGDATVFPVCGEVVVRASTPARIPSD